MGVDSVGVAYTGRRFGSDEIGRGVVRELFGGNSEPCPATAVRLAGVDPLSTDVFDLVAAFEKRGSSIVSSNDPGNQIPEWKLSAPIGLPGVTTVEITGFVRHLFKATYNLASVSDYERYVLLLDQEYGESRRSTNSGRAVRYWSAGRMAIVGRHCAKEAKSTIAFHSEVAADQLTAYVEKKEKNKVAKPSPDKPTIDRDNF